MRKRDESRTEPFVAHSPAKGFCVTGNGRCTDTVLTMQLLTDLLWSDSWNMFVPAYGNTGKTAKKHIDKRKKKRKKRKSGQIPVLCLMEPKGEAACPPANLNGWAAKGLSGGGSMCPIYGRVLCAVISGHRTNPLNGSCSRSRLLACLLHEPRGYPWRTRGYLFVEDRIYAYFVYISMPHEMPSGGCHIWTAKLPSAFCCRSNSGVTTAQSSDAM